MDFLHLKCHKIRLSTALPQLGKLMVASLRSEGHIQDRQPPTTHHEHHFLGSQSEPSTHFGGFGKEDFTHAGHFEGLNGLQFSSRYERKIDWKGIFFKEGKRLLNPKNHFYAQKC